MPRPIRILVLEDSPDDYDLIVLQLRRDGWDAQTTRVDTQEHFAAAVRDEPWEAIISDYNLPAFSAPDALTTVRDLGKDIPFIVVTGSIGEDRAVDLMRRGAHDFVLKEHLGRLSAAIERAIGDAAVRRERTQAIDQLRMTNRELATLVAAAPLAIMAIDRLGRVRGWNEAATRLLGWPAEEVVGKQIPQLDGERAPHFSQLHQQVLAGRTLTSVETDLRHREGHAVEVSLSMAPLGLDGGCLAIVEGIAERKRLEAMLLQSQKLEAIGLLAGGVAHDFNNILGVILGFGELLLTKAPPGNPAHRPAEEICRAASRASSLTKQLLTFSRKQAVQVEILDLNDIVRRMQGMLHRLIGEHIELASDLHQSPLPIRCNASQIEVVIMNLVINARDAMPQGGRIRIATAWSGEPGAEASGLGEAVMTVSDTGTGMDEATQARIFEPFFTTKERGRGTGLGLSTVFGVVQHSGGRIAVASALGQGTTFSVHLPVVQPSAQPGAGPALPAGRGSESILVVEDEVHLRELILEQLRDSGYTVFAAGDAEEACAIHRAHAGRIHLLLTDVVMPGMNGVALARKLQQSDPHLRVVYMSGYTDDVTIRHGVHPDHGAIIEKPFRSEALLHLVRQALDAQPATGRVPAQVAR